MQGCRISRPDSVVADPGDPFVVAHTELPTEVPCRTYRCERATESPALDGTFEDVVWTKAPWTEEFVVVRRRGPVGSVRTRAKLLWDDSYLYCAVELLEPQVSLEGLPPSRHDVELMVAGDPAAGGYQIELFGMGTLVDAWFDGNGSLRGAFHKWDAKGLRTSVQRSTDGAAVRWTAGFALPWSTLSPAGHGPRLDQEVGQAPQAGTTWRVDIGRTTWRPLAPDEDASPKPVGLERAVWQPPAEASEPRGWGVLEFAP